MAIKKVTEAATERCSLKIVVANFKILKMITCNFSKILAACNCIKKEILPIFFSMTFHIFEETTLTGCLRYYKSVTCSFFVNLFDSWQKYFYEKYFTNVFLIQFPFPSFLFFYSCPVTVVEILHHTSMHR